jgi:hypothetical protein
VVAALSVQLVRRQTLLDLEAERVGGKSAGERLEPGERLLPGSLRHVPCALATTSSRASAASARRM